MKWKAQQGVRKNCVSVGVGQSKDLIPASVPYSTTVLLAVQYDTVQQ